MESPPANSATDPLGPGIKEKDLVEAIKRSGYPLQTVVARELRRNFKVQEEWSFIDSDSQEQRTIDLHAALPLYEIRGGDEQPRVRPTLNLLIECKQSVLPYIFFLSDSKPWLPDFPALAGLAKSGVTVTTDDDPSSWSFSLLHALGLESHAFLSSPNYCSTLSKCVRKGSELDLSGSESYNGLVLPLLKSVLHFQAAERPPKTAVYFDAHLVVAVGVIDAPMVGVTVDGGSPSLAALQWVRVTRHESLEGDHKSERARLRAIDIVHRHFLTEYLSHHLLPFAKDFGALALKHQMVLAECEAFIAGMGKDSWGKIESRLKQKSLVSGVSRAASVGRRMMKQFGKKNEDA